MSINDEVVLYWYENRSKWILKRGNETFYDDDRFMREWTMPEDAIDWAQESLGVEVVFVTGLK